MTHQHVTNKHRTKRVDTRPNSKARLHDFQRKEALKKVHDIRITKVSKELRKERELPPSQGVLKIKLSKNEILVRSLKKKLRNIDDLIKRRDERGEVLDEAQLQKINRLDEVMSEMDTVLSNVSKLPVKSLTKNNNKDDEERKEKK